MKGETDKVSCHSSRRGGSEHQPGEEDKKILAAARDGWKAALATHLVSDAEEPR